MADCLPPEWEIEIPRIGHDARVVLQTIARAGKLGDQSLLPKIFPAG